MIKKITLRSVLFLLVFGLAIVVGSSGQNRADKSKKQIKPKIYVSVPPLAYFVEQIGGNSFEIVTMIKPGQSPATFETTPKQLTKFSEAKIFYTAGVPFEKHLIKKLKASFENLNIINTQIGIELQHLEHRHHHGDTENNEETVEKSNLDPHTWLDPSLSKIMAKNIYDGLIRYYPADSLQYQQNLTVLLAGLDKIDSDIKHKLEPYKNRSFYCFHPAFGYFARAYNLKQIAIEVDGKEPSARQLANIIMNAKNAKNAGEDKIKIIFTQPQFSDKSARAIAESVGAIVFPIDPLSKDYLNNLKEITDQLVLAFERK